MINRISKNEQRLDNIQLSIKKLEDALADFKLNKKDLDLLNKYYGSKSWFEDKEAFENKNIPQIKAGVLSEDAVWNMNENIKELIEEMKQIIKGFNNN